MARDIEEFLRRAAERRNQQMQQGGQNQPRQPAPRVQDIVKDVEVVQQVEVVREAKTPRQQSLREQGVSEQVQSQINTEGIAAHAEGLGERIQNQNNRLGGGSEKMDAGSGKKSSPQVTAQAIPDQVSTISNDLVQMLSSPSDIRRAILVSEILKRPNFDD